MAKRPATKSENTMSENLNNTTDPLADLALDVTPEAPTELAVETQENDVAKAPVEDDDGYEFGEIEVAIVTEVPTARRLAGGGSKFPFDKLAAPSKDGISTFFVPYKGGDEKKFRRAVQSATTQANCSHTDRYFASRAVTEGSTFKGIGVYRTDDRPAVEAKDDASE